MVKPTSPAEIVTRMDGVLRRSERAEPPAEYLRLGCLEVDLAAHGARVDGRGLALTPTEFRLLSHLAARPRRVFTRSELMGACLPQSNAFDRVVDSHVSSLRRKLIAEGLGKAISAVRGVGYRLDLEADGS